MDEYFVYTEDMEVGYDGKPLISHIEIKVKRGQIVTLIGPNGAGKSTILKSMTKQLKLLGGAVYLDGQSMRQLTGGQLARRLSVVMTDRINTELMTCEDVVSTGRYPYTGKLGILSEQDRKKVREAIEIVHAEDIASCDFHEVSDGQRQKILLARAICQEPDIIVLDEPTSFLDIRHKLELLYTLKEMVKERNIAVLMSLHELDLAQKISDQIVCVHGDRIERYGTPEEIFTSDYIAGLYGITKGSYNAELGCLEMEAADGPPEVFVIGGGGSGIPVYRRLQREGIPFAAGVLHENDVEYQVAKALAAEVITEKAFEPIGEESFRKALQVMRSCREVLCCVETFGTMNARNEELARMGQK